MIGQDRRRTDLPRSVRPRPSGSAAIRACVTGSVRQKPPTLPEGEPRAQIVRVSLARGLRRREAPEVVLRCRLDLQVDPRA